MYILGRNEMLVMGVHCSLMTYTHLLHFQPVKLYVIIQIFIKLMIIDVYIILTDYICMYIIK